MREVRDAAAMHSMMLMHYLFFLLTRLRAATPLRRRMFDARALDAMRLHDAR